MHLPVHTPWRHWPETETLLSVCNTVNAEMRFVGGCVRDTLLGKEVTDVDLATPMLPEMLKEKLEAQNIRIIPTGLSHGTITAVIGKRHFEITTLRYDRETDGRHAVVAFTDNWKEDAARRDFTVNALYADRDGNIYDYFGGLNDLQKKRIRFIGDPQQRIKEDALRILRYFRFQAQLGFEADIEGNAACALQAHLLNNLSGERITQEMLKLLGMEELAPNLLAQMHDADIVPYIFGDDFEPLISPLLITEQKVGYAPDAILRLAWLLILGKEKVINFTYQRWKLSNALIERLIILLNAKHKMNPAMPLAEQKSLLRRLGKKVFIESAILSWAEHNDADYSPMLALAEEWEIPLFPITGQDLLDRGMEPGKAIGERLKKLEALWEESDYQLTKEELLQV